MSVEKTALAKVTRRIIPFLFLLYVIAYLDRANVSFAKLGMNSLPWFKETVFSTGAGIFFLGYFLFEVPSNLIMEKVGARMWIARIMVVWGILATAMAFVHSPFTFYLMRFLLGVGEAGFFPGMILYLTFWYPAKERARAIALFMTATAISNVVGSPLSGAIMTLHNAAGFDGWQWMFMIEGIPACLLGVVVFFYLTDGPKHAKWLSDEERAAIIAPLEREQAAREKQGHHPSIRMLLDRRVAILALIYFCTVTGSYGVSFWLPQMLKTASGLNNFLVGLLNAIPYLAGAIGMVFNARHSDKTGERRLHVAGPAFVAAVGLALSALTKNPWLVLASMTVAQLGLSSYLGPFWTLPSAFLGGTAAAGGIALINSVGNLGGYVGPQVIGQIKEMTHSYEVPLFTLAAIVAIGGVLTLTLKADQPAEHHEEEAIAPAAVEPASA